MRLKRVNWDIQDCFVELVVNIPDDIEHADTEDYQYLDIISGARSNSPGQASLRLNTIGVADIRKIGDMFYLLAADLDAKNSIKV